MEKKDCEMCGNSSPLVLHLVEGTQLNLCSACSKFGKPVKTQNTSNRPIDIKINRQYTKPVDSEFQRVVVDDYGRIIRQHRNSLNLTTEEYASKIAEKASLVNKIESGKLTPSIKLAEKFQRFFGLKLIKYEEASDFNIGSKDESSESTIGDIIKFK